MLGYLRTPFDVPLLLLLVLARVSVWSAADQSAAAGKFWLLVAAVGVYYALVLWIRGSRDQEEAVENLARLLVVFAAVLVVYYLFVADWDAYRAKVAVITEVGKQIQRWLPPVSAESIHPNVFGGVMALVLPFAVALLVQAGQRPLWRHVVDWLLAGLIVFGLILSQSRAAWLSVAVVAVMMELWNLIGRIYYDPRQHQRVFGITIGVTTGTLLFLLVAIPNPIVNTLSNILAEQGRFSLYRDSLMLALDYPILGAGLANFMMNHVTYSYMTHVGFSTHAHNLLLDLSIELGIGGVLLVGWMWTRGFAIAWGYVRRHSLKPILGAGIASMLVIFLHGMLDDPLFSSRALLLLFVPLAFIVPYAPDKPSQSARNLAPMFAVAAVALAFLLWRPLISTALANWGSVLQSRQELRAYEWPQWAIQDELRREIDLSNPIYYYHAALTYHRDNVTANRRLGQIELSLGQYENALTHLQKAYLSVPWDNGTRQLLGEAYIVTGDISHGTSLWSQVDNANGQLNSRAYWYRALGDDQREQSIDLALADIQSLAQSAPTVTSVTSQR